MEVGIRTIQVRYRLRRESRRERRESRHRVAVEKL
jgi:hypothetical protein